MTTDSYALEDLVTSNRVPSDAEAAHAHDIIASTRESLAALDAQIAHLQRNRAALEAEIQAHKCVVSPWRRLLPELVLTIMRHCNTRTLYPAQHPHFVNPFVVGQICSAWRALALATPSLWTSVRVVASELSTAAQARALELLLQRSHPLGLDVEVVCEPLQLQASGEPLAVIQTLRSSSARWRALDVQLTDSLLEALMGGVDLPRLARLVLRNTWLHTPYPPPASHESLPRGLSFQHAPALRALTLFNAYLDTATIVARFPLARLTELDVFVGRVNRPAQFSGAHAPAVLARCPRLRILRLMSVPEACPPSKEDAALVEPVVVPDLHTLEIVAYDRWDLVFDKLALPSLRRLRLEVSCSSWANRWSEDCFARLLQRSGRVRSSCQVSTERGSHVYECSLNEVSL
ncbi:hypothetical protein GLOTRDRAFT_127529 [Gloeophyllum trabeum ATCC 11539]|uniref:F-box domain-containing protein n=1 Tax=Gloeophyllum trabeum (strain ATCC 11539 / FP-39264 / Madison 617) TaxID=670483 RepID=S7QB47_GLOTA|nr:uncharacterized protein GLOTRDRAFT_127529 [Gloeophyllum trabeum ATCC 11539]EPQ57156.1 hypothetical protein GLOTRDRAFT_127529 [Gloeophyllum trabeum ATCC 11539]